MDEVYKRIKETVITLNTDITDDARLDLIVKSVVNRALAYTNRKQFVYYYELAITDGVDVTDPNNCVELPIPEELEIPLAETVISAYEAANQKNRAIAAGAAAVGAVKSVTDNGQKVDFGDVQLSQFGKVDSDVFSGIVALLDRYIVPTISKPIGVDDEYRQPIGIRL